LVYSLTLALRSEPSPQAFLLALRERLLLEERLDSAQTSSRRAAAEARDLEATLLQQRDSLEAEVAALRGRVEEADSRAAAAEQNMRRQQEHYKWVESELRDEREAAAQRQDVAKDELDKVKGERKRERNREASEIESPEMLYGLVR
jgi:hypothetical protein